jgi:peptide deformylase
LIVDMAETMRNANGIGLAATQVGEMHRLLVVDLSAVEQAMEDEHDEPSQQKPREQKTLVVINPEVIDERGSWTMEEGCLSIPEIRADVDRAEVVTIRFRDGNFQETEITVQGLLGRVLLHEIDHLNGVLFLDHLSTTQRTLLKGKLRRIKKGEAETSYPVVSTTPARPRPIRMEV